MSNLDNQLNESYRTALLSYYLGQYVPNSTDTTLSSLVTTPEDVYEYLLIDPLVSNEVTTSRVAQAMSSIQQYINGISFNMEPGYSTSNLDLTQWKAGASQYDVWAGEVELDTYPEDYLDPTLRSTKTTLFTDMETVLNQNQINADTAQNAVMNYLSEFEEVANLEIVSGYMHNEDNTTPNQTTAMYYFLGRTRSTPYTYYWRSLDMSQNVSNVVALGAWSEWKEITLSLAQDNIVATIRPVIYNNRLYISWFERDTVGMEGETQASPQSGTDIIRLSAYIAYLRFDDSWSSPQCIDSILSNDYTRVIDPSGVVTGGIIQSELFGSNVIDKLYSVATYYYSGDANKEMLYVSIFTESTVENVQYDAYEIGINNWGDRAYFGTTMLNAYYPSYAGGKQLVVQYESGHSTDTSIQDVTPGETGGDNNDFFLTEIGILYPFSVTLDNNDTVNISVNILTNQGFTRCGTFHANFFSGPNYTDFAFNRSWDVFSSDTESKVRNDTAPSNIPFTLYDKNNNAISYPSIQSRVSSPFPLDDGDTCWMKIDNPDYKSDVAPLTELTFYPNEACAYNGEWGVDLITKVISTSTSSTDQTFSFSVPAPLDNGDLTITYGGNVIENNATTATAWRSYTITFASGSPIYSPTITTIANTNGLGTAEYLQFDGSTLEPIRLNTLFAKELINKASVSIDNLLTWDTQMMQEPSLTDASQSVPMDFNGANGLYFWEMFFHMPYLVAWRLNQEQQYDDAQTWFNYIFDPSALDRGTETDGTPVDYWNVRPLVELPQGESQGDVNQGATDPDLIAVADPTHYQKAIFMAYVGNIIDNADSDYRLLTNDGLSEAKLRYCQAKDLLGPRPDVQLVNQWKPDTLANVAGTTNVAMRQYEQQVEDNLVAAPGVSYAAQTVGDNPNFLSPLNTQLLNYWDLIDSRLYNLRHNLSIDGTPMTIPLYAVPVNPTVLMQSAQSGSLTSSAAVLSATIPPYRFNTMLHSTLNAVNTLCQYGQTLLSYYERGDSMALQEQQQQQMLNISSFNVTLQQNAIDSLKAEQTALQTSRKMADQRYSHYLNLYNENISSSESEAMDKMTDSGRNKTTGSPLITAAGVTNMIPNIFGMSVGGSVWGSALTASGLVLEISAGISQTDAQRMNTSEGYRRRREEWQIQYQQAQSEMAVIDKQADALTIRQTAAQNALQQAQAQQSDLQTNLSFMKSRFTQASLYTWLNGQLSALYYQAYDAVLSLCLSTQACWQYELGDVTTQFIQTGAWNDSYHGLLAGETLQLSLIQMESAWLSRNQRRFELTKSVSLKALDPTSFTALISSGTIAFSLSEHAFDEDYPGHYLRQIKTVTVTLPTLVGAYQDIAATLTQSSSSTLLKADMEGVTYLNDSTKGKSTNILVNPRASQQITLSSGINDSGLFELNFGDERYLPFEGTGAISTWQLDFPFDTDDHKAILTNLNDVIVNVYYTALYGGSKFESDVASTLA
ncbi:neuraminidase-like domain-containing protein [Edaphovirga cremea]|uniref:Tc toxin subunit A-related protein n=1 Tax=Edaphovirga cremea TaxID=2267246 RepID=UPI003988B439